MSRQMSRRGLQLLLRFLGLVAFVAGLGTVIFGVASVAGAEAVSGTVDSEMRFYAVWYSGAGLLLLRSARRVEREATIVRGISVALFVAGCSRALSWMVVGEPHVVAQVLMVIELSLPLVIVPWQASVTRIGTEHSE
ncbi:MAG: DUF4345 domain-containing protein [Actinomycetota bacterium]|nr:DUF4345 domain-containing protein [Actinomycetota bacterium]